MPSSPALQTPLPPGRREQRKRLTRRELLAAGRKLFSEEGLYESRIEDLARHAGIAKGTLYGYFASKEELMEAVVAAGFSELLGYVHHEAQGSRTHEELLSLVAEAHLAFFEENPDLLRVFHQVRGLLKFDHPEARGLRKIMAGYLAALAHVLALRPRATRRGAPNDLAAATLLFGAVSGILSTRAALAGALPRHRSSATTRALVALVHGFQAPADGKRAPR